MLVRVRKVEFGHQHQDSMVTASRPWNRLAATEGQRAPLVDPAKEAIVPQAVLTVQLRPLHQPLVQPLIYLLHHILRTHKETAAADLRVAIGASQTRTELEMRSGHIAHVRHLPLKQRLMTFAATPLTHSKLCDGKKAP